MILKTYNPAQASYSKSKFSYAENRRFDAFVYLFLLVIVLMVAVYTAI